MLLLQDIGGNLTILVSGQNTDLSFSFMSITGT